MPGESDRTVLPPSGWVVKHGGMIPPGGEVLDVACGSGRHGRFFRSLGHPVVMLDRDISQVADMASDDDVEIVAQDLEGGRPWPLAGRQFAGVIVVNYLHRPMLPALVASVQPGGALIYDTFAVGNEAYGWPSNPDYLLHREELLIAVRPELVVMAFEDVEETEPRPAVRQRIMAVRPKRSV
ncbi:class I SAM-dependent methyltransferase [Thalassobaculum sp.]|uniref:class I SAM-dependent methyltransferase n=1 Tax=Thalassobaculum sp. TaxID=2022740 RepID=UPI0032ED513C